MKLKTYFIFFAFLLASKLSCEESNYQFIGSHFLVSYYQCDPQMLDDREGLISAMTLAIEKSGATLLKMSDYQFTPHGVTLVALLSESHASIHTYPEFGACFVDFFTCGTKCDYKEFDKILKQALGSQESFAQFIERR